MAVGLQHEINVTGAISAGLSWSFAHLACPTRTQRMIVDRLPTKDDFVPHPPDLDEVSRAWEHFGGLTLDEAKARFARIRSTIRRLHVHGDQCIPLLLSRIGSLSPQCEDEENDDDYESWMIAQCIHGRNSNLKRLIDFGL